MQRKECGFHLGKHTFKRASRLKLGLFGRFLGAKTLFLIDERAVFLGPPSELRVRISCSFKKFWAIFLLLKICEIVHGNHFKHQPESHRLVLILVISEATNEVARDPALVVVERESR